MEKKIKNKKLNKKLNKKKWAKIVHSALVKALSA